MQVEPAAAPAVNNRCKRSRLDGARRLTNAGNGRNVMEHPFANAGNGDVCQRCAPRGQQTVQTCELVVDRTVNKRPKPRLRGRKHGCGREIGQMMRTKRLAAGHRQETGQTVAPTGKLADREQTSQGSSYQRQRLGRRNASGHFTARRIVLKRSKWIRTSACVGQNASASLSTR